MVSGVITHMLQTNRPAKVCVTMCVTHYFKGDIRNVTHVLHDVLHHPLHTPF